jgi:hypothetical protein
MTLLVLCVIGLEVFPIYRIHWYTGIPYLLGISVYFIGAVPQIILNSQQKAVDGFSQVFINHSRQLSVNKQV